MKKLRNEEVIRLKKRRSEDVDPKKRQLEEEKKELAEELKNRAKKLKNLKKEAEARR